MEYEDEVERMRARRQRRGQAGKRRSERMELEVIDFNNYDDSQIRRSAPRRQVQDMRARRPAEDLGARREAEKKKKAGRKRKRRFLMFELLLLCILLAGTYFYFFRKKESKYWTVAVFGVDSREGSLEKDTHSDVEMVCVVNRETGEIRIVSIYRDTYLQVSAEGKYHKINQAYFDGGHEQAVDALNRNLDLSVDDYATFNWKAVADAINILGGIDLEISDSEFRYINGFITATVESTGIGSYQLEHAGMQHLDGVQAVAYARLRLMDTDYHRTARQRLVLTLAMEKAKQADFDTLLSVVGAVFPQISTSVGVNDLVPLAKNVKKFYIGETGGFPFSRGEADVGKKDCVIPLTLESNVIQLHQFLYDDIEYQPSSTVRQISAKIASDSGMGEVKENAPEAKVGGSSGSSANQTPQTQPQEVQTPAETVPEEIIQPTETQEPESSPEETEEASSEPGPLGPGVYPEEESSESPKQTTSEDQPLGPYNPTSASTSPGGPGYQPSREAGPTAPANPEEDPVPSEAE